MFYEVIPGREAGRIDGVLTYKYDGALASGTIVEIPVGRKKSSGVVIKKVAQPEFRCREITRILYSKVLPEHLIKAARWMNEYYLAPLSACIGMMLPVGVLKQRRARKSEQMFGNDDSGERAGMASLADGTPCSGTCLEDTIPLNPHQKNALEGLQKAPGATKLLFGVTGSGKTNIYLRRALDAFQSKKSVVLLVPEIALTGQLVRIFRERFGGSVVLIHSKQTEAERHAIFDSLLTHEEPKVVIGPRSALMAPLDDLGLIIIDEEHENTYYQENPPRYSAIRLASYMAGTLKCDVVLGSATPTVSDYYIAREKGSLIMITDKAKDTAVKPEIKIIGFKDRDAFSRNRYFSNALLAAIQRNLEQGWQTLIFHNRRGSSPLTICENCGNELVCPNCFLPLTLHADRYNLVCHTCGYSTDVPAGCPKCGHPELIHKGFGTKLLETELVRLFPKARVMRFDADSKKGEDLASVYTEVKEGRVDIVLGTQVVAKGLDLPKLATVGIVQADTGLSLPDFAAEERVFQLITQVIGRVGRGHLETAEVFIQTYQPEHPVLKFATEEDYTGFANYLLKQRRRGGFPPYKYVMRLDVTMKTEATVIKKVQQAVNMLRKDKWLSISPPMPAFHEHTAQGYTWEIVVRSTSRKALVEACSLLDKNFRISLDVPSLL